MITTPTYNLLLHPDYDPLFVGRLQRAIANYRHNIYVVSMIALDAATGYLPKGVHRMSQSECARLFAWNARRRFLFIGLGRAMANLSRAGCRAVLVDGSYVTAKELPNDWDAAFDPTGVIPEHLDPILIKHDDGRRSMRAKYLGDMFPWTHAATIGGPLYRQFFQHDRDGNPKGIVAIELQASP